MTTHKSKKFLCLQALNHNSIGRFELQLLENFNFISKVQSQIEIQYCCSHISDQFLIIECINFGLFCNIVYFVFLNLNNSLV